MTTVAIGLIGCGRMGRAHLAAADGVAGIEIAAVTDPSVAVPGITSVPLDDLLDRSAAVVVAAPTPAHAELVTRALMRGRHVLCEKPLTLDPDEDTRLERLAADRGLVLQVGFWRRFAEPYRRLRQLVVERTIGEVTAIRAAQWDAVAPPAAFCDPQMSGGLEIDCGVHEFDIAHWLLGGNVEKATALSPPASGALAAVGDVDTVQGIAGLSQGRAMTIDLTRTAGHRDSIRTEVLGSNGSAVLDFTNSGTLTVRHGDRADVTMFDDDVIATALAEQLRAFAAAVRTGRIDPDAASGTDSRRALLAARLLRDARLTGTWRVMP